MNSDGDEETHVAQVLKEPPVPQLAQKKPVKLEGKAVKALDVSKPSKTDELARAKSAMSSLGLVKDKATGASHVENANILDISLECMDEFLKAVGDEDDSSLRATSPSTMSSPSDLDSNLEQSDESDEDSDWKSSELFSSLAINEVKMIGAMSANMYINIQLGDENVHALIDSGAQATLMTHDVYKKLSRSLDLPIYESKIKLLDHNQRKIVQTTSPRLVPFQVGRMKLTHPTYVIDNGTRNGVLLGLDFLKAAKLNIITYGPEPTVSVGDPSNPSEVIPTVSELPAARAKRVRLAAKHRLVLHPNEQAFVQCEIAQELYSGLYSLKPLLPAHMEQSFCSPEGKESLAILVANMTDQDLDIGEGTELAEALHADPYGFTPEITDEDVEKATDLCLFPENNGVKNLRQHLLDDPTFPKELVDDLCHYVNTEVPEVISKEEFDIGNLKLPRKYYYDYAPDDDQLPTCKPYTFNGVREDQIEKYLARFEEHGLVEHAVSPAASPGFLIARKTRNEGEDKLRFLVDYRALNAVLPMPKYPLPFWHNVMHKLQGKDWFTNIDITSAFTAVPMTERAQKAAAIVTSRGQWVPKRMMQGLSTSAQHFAYVMSKVMEPVKDVASHFQDDVMVVTKGSKLDHLRDIKRVLKALQDAGLKINFKANFFQKEVKFLGRIINGQGHRPLPKHIKSLKEMKKPTTKKELMAILGVTAWLSPYVHNYSTKIKALTSALSSSPFTFSEDHEKALESIQQEIGDNTALYFPDPNSPMYLAADSTARGFGAILYQVVSYRKDELTGKEKPHEWPKPEEVTNHPVLPPPNKKVLLPEMPTKNPKKKKAKTEEEKEREGTIAAINAHHDLTLTDAVSPEKDKIHLVKAVAFASGAYSGAALAYSSIEKEFLCILLSLEQLKTFLYSAESTYVLTDCAPILWCLKYRYSRITKLEKYAIKLLSMPFKIIVHHLKGSIHPGDLMSRTIKVEEPTTTLGEAKRAIVVSTPFHPCELTSLDQLIKYVEENPDCVQVPAPEPAVISSVTTMRDDLKQARIQKVTYASLETMLGRQLELDNIMLEQRLDEKWKGIVKSLQSGENQPSYSLQKGLLMKEKSDPQGNTTTVPVLTFNLAVFAIALFHLHNHCGYHALWTMLKREYYFPKLKNLVRRFTRACDLCIQYSASTSPKEALGMTPLPLKKADSWMIDLVTGLPKIRGKDGFLSIVCEFSNFRLAVPVSSTITATGVIDLLKSHVVATFGVMNHLRSDRGSNLLLSKQMTQFCNFYGIRRHLSVPNHPQGHGRVEVSNRYIQSLVLKLASQYDSAWVDILALAVHELNCKPRAVFKGLSPHFVMFGEQPQVTTQSPREKDITIDPDLLHSFHAQLKEETKKLVKHAEAKMLKQNQEKGGKRTIYAPGTLLYLKNFRILPKRKIQSKYHSSPHVVVKDYGPTVLCKNLLGIVSLQAKENVRLAPAREVEVFGKLPFELQMVVGAPFSPQEIAEAVRSGKIPEFWSGSFTEAETEPELPGPVTRGRAKKMKILDDAQEAELSKSLEKEAETTLPEPSTQTSGLLPPVKKVTFDLPFSE
jgi:hypothetical protein